MSDDGHHPDVSFVPELDARQRAMLAEMGVRVWAPKAAVPSAAGETARTPPIEPVRPPVAAAPATAPERPRPAPARAVVATPATAPALAPQRGPEPAWVREIETLDWEALQAAVGRCEACGLCRSRQQAVFGSGQGQADWMVVGDPPGEEEDRQGEPFVGTAGQLLDNMLRAIGVARDGERASAAFITNVVKCRPPANRNPSPQELAQCEPYLSRQVALVQPRLILAMGRFAVQALLQTSEPIGKLRGQVHRYQGVPVIVTYHPAYLLRTPADKRKAWADLCLALATLGG